MLNAYNRESFIKNVIDIIKILYSKLSKNLPLTKFLIIKEEIFPKC